MAVSWVYLDETAHMEVVAGKPRFRDMIVGGCVASQSKWEKFSREWRKALDDEEVEVFHGKDFFSFNREFRWYKDGERDIARHVGFRNRLIEIILDNVDAITGYCTAAEQEDAKPVRGAYRKSIANAFRTLAREWGDKVSIVLARHPELSPWTVLKTFEQMNWDDSLSGCGVFEPADVLPLQAADFILHGALQRWRNNSEDEVFVALRDGAKARQISWRVHIATTFQFFDSAKK